ncbi:MAG: outer membrane lipoprotein carrier protein LolA, partial [Desulfobacteraceae bacterium]|nr:outer membrane lipoprotein carrier protein LolA [Desulfobacteraceae bacterium]
MTRTTAAIFFLISILAFWVPQGRAESTPKEDAKTPDMERILNGIEQRYSGKGFTATFFQESILKAMQMTDTAEGRLTVKRPGKMRWEYVVPDPQTIITDGTTMWMDRPKDKQVTLVKAPERFSSGKGAGFLSDVRQIRKSFNLESLPAESPKYYRVKLLPHKP